MTDIKKTVTFTDDVEVLNPQGEVTFSAKAGDSKSLPAASANRWIRRNKATAGKPPAKKTAAKKAVEKADGETTKTDK